jgi:hypothetical protein
MLAALAILPALATAVRSQDLIASKINEPTLPCNVLALLMQRALTERSRNRTAM